MSHYFGHPIETSGWPSMEVGPVAPNQSRTFYNFTNPLTVWRGRTGSSRMPKFVHLFKLVFGPPDRLGADVFGRRNQRLKVFPIDHTATCNARHCNNHFSFIMHHTFTLFVKQNQNQRIVKYFCHHLCPKVFGTTVARQPEETISLWFWHTIMVLIIFCLNINPKQT